MKSVKATHLDGDVSIGRDVAIGGGATVQGDSHFKGGLKVDGWLEVDGIQSNDKGRFNSIDELQESYPEPQDGWWATIGPAPGMIYIATDGLWNFSSYEYDNLIPRDSRGAANGIAPLDGNKLVPYDNLPPYVIEFSATREGIKSEMASSTHASYDDNCHIIYDADANRFVILATDNNQQQYFRNWRDSWVYGTNTTLGIMPYPRRIYLDKETSIAYCWDGLSLKSLSSIVFGENCIQRYHIAPNAIGPEQLAATVVTNDKIAGGAVTPDKIKLKSLTRGVIAFLAIGPDELDSNAVNEHHIADNSITPNKLSKNAVKSRTLSPEMRGAWSLNVGPVITTRSLNITEELKIYAEVDAIPTYTISTNTTVNAMGAIADEAARPMFVLKMQSSATGERIITVRDYFGEMTLTLGTGQCAFITFVKAIVPNGQTFGETVTQEQYVVSSTLIR